MGEQTDRFVQCDPLIPLPGIHALQVGVIVSQRAAGRNCRNGSRNRYCQQAPRHLSLRTHSVLMASIGSIGFFRIHSLSPPHPPGSPNTSSIAKKSLFLHKKNRRPRTKRCSLGTAIRPGPRWPSFQFNSSTRNLIRLTHYPGTPLALRGHYLTNSKEDSVRSSAACWASVALASFSVVMIV